MAFVAYKKGVLTHIATANNIIYCASFLQ